MLVELYIILWCLATICDRPKITWESTRIVG